MNNDHRTTKTGPEFWMSIEHFNGDAEFAKRAEEEFMSSPLRSEDGNDGVARREFLKLMGASVAMATTACVRRPVQHIIPYAQAPKEIVPGIPNFYTSTWYDGVEGYGLLVKTLEGRPIKLEGNPLHPMNKGALSARVHAEVLSLYDPDRLKAPVRNLQNKARTNREIVSAEWADLDKEVVENLKKGGVAVLTSTLPSPSTQSLLNDFQKTFSARTYTIDSLPADVVREGQKRSYGQAVLPRYRFDAAKVVVSIDADFLGAYLSPVEAMKQWSKRRQPTEGMGRLVVFESQVSLTGLNADDRFRIKPSQQLDVVYSLINAVAKASKGAANLSSNISSAVRKFENLGEKLGLQDEEAESMNKTVQKLAQQLWENRGAGIVLAGGLPTYTESGVDLQIAVNLLNSVLGNDGKTIDHSNQQNETLQGSSESLATLIEEINSGRVKSLIIHNVNPVYSLPESSGFLAALKKLSFVVYTGNRNDETGLYADYVLPQGSLLEQWGDFELQSGLYSVLQPTLRPLYQTRSFEESLLAWMSGQSNAPARAKDVSDFYSYLQAVWKSEIYPRASEGRGKSFDEFWLQVLQNGVVNLRQRDQIGSSRSFNASSFSVKERKPSSGYELVLYPTSQLADGRYANVAWLQELPDPVTKIVWDNHVMVSPATARKEGLSEGDVIEVMVAGKSLQVPTHIQPGLHDDVLAISVGYGRKEVGQVGRNIGVNGFELATFVGKKLIYAGQSANFKKVGKKHTLVSTQIHHVMEGRQLAVETTKESYLKDPNAGIHRHKIFSIWPEHTYSKKKWGMAIDLNTCTGCSACVVACQSENNIPVVGKRYIMEGREMHWIRIDRYYKGSMEQPDAVFMPIMCQHCETAPCETVCPVLATVHNEEGLNDMVYNRCVGTRYCANNCPYKVRRFNWFNYTKNVEAPMHMAYNPDVTVRARGVMEKCTLCVQRIRAHKAGTTGVESADGKAPELKTACQQTCPADAIVFGDLNDRESAVNQFFREQRTYDLLEDLNTQPRVRYMARIRNADRVVEGHHDGGHGDSHDKNHDSHNAPEHQEHKAKEGEHV